MTRLLIDIAAFAAWSPGLTTTAAWRTWAISPTAFTLDGSPDVPEVSANVRRRLDRRGRMAIRTTIDVDPNADAGAYVFATPLGEVARSAELLDAISRREPMSPSMFATSVHNAIGATYSIARGIHAPIVATSAGDDTAATALVEGFAAWVETGRDVVVTYFDEAIPPVYAGCGVTSAGPFAWSVRLGVGGERIRLTLRGSNEPATAAAEPGANALRFLLGAVDDAVTGSWHWSRRRD